MNYSTQALQTSSNYLKTHIMAGPKDRSRAFDEAYVDVESEDEESMAVVYSATLLSDLLISTVESASTRRACLRQVEAIQDFMRFFERSEDPTYEEIIEDLEKMGDRLQMGPELSIDNSLENDLIRLSKRFRDLYIRTE